MEIQKKQYEFTILTPNEGMYITQVNRGEDAPVMSKKVILGKNDKPENWIEIPIEEGDAIMAQWQAEQERKMQEEDARMQEEMNNATR